MLWYLFFFFFEGMMMIKIWDECVEDVWVEVFGEEVGDEMIVWIDVLVVECGLDDVCVEFECVGVCDFVGRLVEVVELY